MISISGFKSTLYEKCGYCAGDGVTVGISGGADSMSLLHLLWRTLEGDAFIGAVHINHGIRGDEAERDTEQVRRFCNELGVPCKVVYRNIPAEAAQLHISEEEAGRRARYEEFASASEQWSTKYTAVAHNRNDQAETVMMNILRGSGVNGISGMSFRSGNIIRPLLETERADIEQYCMDNKLPFVYDSTNGEDVYTRNKIRLKVLPYITEQTGKNAVRKLAELAEAAGEENDFMACEAIKLYNSVKSSTSGCSGAVLDINALSKAHSAMVKRVILLAASEVRGSAKDISRKNLEDVLKLIYAGGTGKQLTFANGLRTETEYGMLRIYMANTGADCIENACNSVTCDISEETFEPGRLKEYIAMNRRPLHGESMSQMCFDADKVRKIPGELCIRGRCAGDRFFLDGGQGSKKLKSFLIDMKVPKEQRERLTVAAKGTVVLGICEIRAFGGFELDENTKKVLILRF